jgi:hypothetical protein
MKALLMLLVMLGPFAHAQVIPITGPYPTQKYNDHLPGTLPPEEGSFEKVVEDAQKFPTEEVIKESSDKTSQKKSKSKRDDSLGTVMVGYQLLTTWIPSKKLISYTHIFNDKWSLEFEYARSSLSVPIIAIDLGEVSERRYSLLARRYVGNSFHYTFGPYFNQFDAEVGSSILNRIGTETTSSFETAGGGLALGIGNRWHWDNGFTLGLEWFRMNVPLFVTKVESRILNNVSDDDDEDDIQTVIRRFNRIPTFVLFGIKLGYTF